MREILFRGKCDGEWVYGSLHIEQGETDKNGNRSLDYRILGMRGECCYVLSETVGQYTGLTDKNGTKIFEGDIVEIVTVDKKEKRKFVVEIGECLETNEEVCCYAVYHRFFGTPITFPINHIDLTEVIGNIHYNMELLGVE